MPKAPHMDEAMLANELDLVELREGVRDMFAMMRQQRDSFRLPRTVGHVLGAAHSDATRHSLAELLDWYLTEYEAKLSELLTN